MNPRWTAIVMAAGVGSRMKSATPKVAHSIAGRPIVRHVIDAAREAGVADAVVVVGPDEGGDAVRAAAGDDVVFAVQQQRLGTGNAVESAREAASSADFVLILNGDVPLVLPDTLRRLRAAVEDDDAAMLAILTAEVPVESYGFLEMKGHYVLRIIETKEAEGIDRGEPRLINAGQYAARASWLWARLEHITSASNGERYLTQLAAMAYDEGHPSTAVLASEAIEVRGINDRVQLAEAEAFMRQRILHRHMLGGVTVVDPQSTYIDVDVVVGADTVIEPHTHLRGATSIGPLCVIGPGSHIVDSTLGEHCMVRHSMIESSVLEDGVDVGPYCHVRPQSHLGEGVHLGNFAEVKASRLGNGTKMGHFSYIGDSEIGEGVNIGAGTVTANYDGVAKHRTVVGDGAFIGSDTMLVAPVTIGRGSRTGVGAVVTRDVPDGMIAIGAPARIRSLAATADTTGEDNAGR
jgi:bifunctional UDP-N-acetylglucosamine pyrophosphorylase/glucosamine-1-phosphate N-acetyltransferase